MKSAFGGLASIATLIIVVAIVVLIVKGNAAANTIQSAGALFTGLLKKAYTPLT